jgi:hypothetical protein
MIEVFKTNVQESDEVKLLIGLLLDHLPGSRINIDLHDCDKILRVEGKTICNDLILQLVKERGFWCEILE